MKKLVISIFVLCLGIISVVNAQDKSKTMVQERITYMKTNLTLSGKENNSFWKVYEQYLNEEIKAMETHKNNLEKQGIKLGASGTNKDVIAKLSDKQITYMQDQKFELRKTLLNLESTYHKKFKQILSPRHLQDFYDLEFKFKREMTKKQKEVKKDAKKDETGPVNAGKKKR